jgi:micrococcal nuclease
MSLRHFVTAALLVVSIDSAAAVGQSAARVQRVIDGDTVVLDTVGTVRLIGVDTPETVDPRKPVQEFGVEAAFHVRSMLEGRQVRLEYDQQRLDKYGRTLAYLYLVEDGTFVNLEIIRQGYGHAYLNYPFRQMELFREAEREAREANRGLWAQSGKAAQAPVEPAKVWVNTSSHVYHCPGTRYYGKTARGAYLSEDDARKQGNRPAYGRECGAASRTPAATTPTTTAEPKPAARALTSGTKAQSSAVRVWVNTSSHVYHCAGSRYYGNTKNGTYMSQSEAAAAGNRPAGGNECRS